MCGRFVRKKPSASYAGEFWVDASEADVLESFNVAPTQDVAVILDDGTRQLVSRRWGLIPSWATDPAIGARLINARAETLTEKAAFRDSFKRRRCLVIADG